MYADEKLGILGYSCDEDGFPFNFSTSIAARRVISDFIASNVTVSHDRGIVQGAPR